MITDRELWACANQVLESHGEAADRFIANRVAALAAAGDRDGVSTWIAIADRVDQLRQTSSRERTSH